MENVHSHIITTIIKTDQTLDIIINFKPLKTVTVFITSWMPESDVTERLSSNMSMN